MRLENLGSGMDQFYYKHFVYSGEEELFCCQELTATNKPTWLVLRLENFIKNSLRTLLIFYSTVKLCTGNKIPQL